MAQVKIDPSKKANNARIVAGEGTLSSGSVAIATGLSTVVSVNVSLKDATAPGVTTSVVSYGVSGGTVTLYGWKVTGSGDATLIAATDADVVSYSVVGY
jgi:hypothetical protein